MPSIIDIFRSDAYGVVELTDRINRAPYRPQRLGQLGLFRNEGVPTLTVAIEKATQGLELIPTTPRGGQPTTLDLTRPSLQAFTIPHMQRESTIYADQLFNLRELGGDGNPSPQSLEAEIDKRFTMLRNQFDVTMEFHRMGAIKGVVYDADGTTALLNLYTAFGETQTVVDFDFTANSITDMRQKLVGIMRTAEDELGDSMVSGYRVLAGDQWFDNFIAHANVREVIEIQGAAGQLREDQRRGFNYAGITFENYRGKVGSINFIATGEAYMIPEGTDQFVTYYGPGDFLDAIGTVGLPFYARRVLDNEYNRWVKLHAQSNPLTLNLRPKSVIKFTGSNFVI